MPQGNLNAVYKVMTSSTGLSQIAQMHSNLNVCYCLSLQKLIKVFWNKIFNLLLLYFKNYVFYILPTAGSSTTPHRTVSSKTRKMFSQKLSLSWVGLKRCLETRSVNDAGLWLQYTNRNFKECSSEKSKINKDFRGIDF